MHIPKVICGIHDQEMVVDLSGVVTEMVNDSGPYYKVAGDVYVCPGLQCQVTLLAQAAIAEHYHAVYSQVRASRQATFTDASRLKG